MKVAIVILNWNGENMLRLFLPSVLRHSTDEATVFVADNASTDHSLELLKSHFPQVSIITLDQNYGFAEGYNKALQQVEAHYYVLLNSDVEVTPHWLTPLIRLMEANPLIAACQPKLRAEQRRTHFEYAGAAGGFIDRYGYPFCRGRMFTTVEEDLGQYDEPRQVFWATGACLMIRADDYWKAGALDGRFFAHSEEIDLCWRLNHLGRQVWCCPSSVIYHLGGGTLPKGNPRKTFLNFRNNLTMLYKNLPDKERDHVMRCRWWLDYLAAWQTLLMNANWGDFKAIFKARKAFKRWRHNFDDDHQRILQQSVGAKAMQPTPVSLLWQYYAKGKKYFSSLNI